MKSKKGALELSMNTIIIIIIGVTILSLGLLFVRGIFKQVESLSKSAFETADAEIGQISNVDKPLTLVPKDISVEQGSAETVEVIIANFEPNEINIQVTATPPTNNPKIDCSFADTMQPYSNQYILASGQQASITLIVDEKNGPLGNYVCNIDLSGEGLPATGDFNDQLIVRVVKK